MIKIDGSQGEGGGQILRTATALSALTGKDTRINNIRANRSTPGLRPQHLKGIEALAELSDAEIIGAEVHSQEIIFEPGEVKPKNIKVDIETAGSVTLLLQSVMPALIGMDEEVEIEVKGGTDVKWSPPIDYLRYVLLPLLDKHGYRASVELNKRGFYPEGGGKVVFRFRSSDLKEFDLEKRGEIQEVGGISYASQHLKDAKVVDRQAKAATKALWEEFEETAKIKEEYCDSRSPGSGLQIWLKTTNSVVGGNALGEKGRPSEKIGKEAARDLIKNSTGCVDRYAADQLVPYLGISGGRISVPEITGHCKTNMMITEKFIDKRFSTKDCIIEVK